MLNKTTTASIVLLSTLAGTAFAQTDGNITTTKQTPEATQSSPHTTAIELYGSRQAIQLATRAEMLQTSLANAVQIAEKHCNGTAIGCRISPSIDTIIDVRSYKNRLNRELPMREDSVDEASNVNRPTDYSVNPSCFATVTCVMENSQVRDVIVDMRQGSVVGMASAANSSNMYWPSEARITMYNVYGDSQRAEASDASRAPRLYRATDIMNTRVENFSNESIGTISDFAIQGRTGRVVYGVLSRGGFLGIGESLYAVPTEELANYKNDKLTVGFDTEVLDSFNGFDDDNWPLQSNLQWTSNPVEANDNKHEVYEVVKASEVVGETLKTREGEDVGTISDLVIDPMRSRVAFVIVRTDAGNVAIPMGVCHFFDTQCIVNIEKEQVDTAATFTDEYEPVWDDAEWSRRLHETFNVKPYWDDANTKQMRSSDASDNR